MPPRSLPRRVAGKLKRTLLGPPPAGPAPAASPITYQAEGASAKWYIHELSGHVPDADRFGFRDDDGGPPAERAEIVDRLIRYGQRLGGATAGSAVGEHQDMWLFIAKGHEPLRRAVTAGDAPAVADLLRQMATGPLVAGFMNFEPYDRLRDKPEVRRIEATHFADKLLSLAEATGCLPVQGVEQGVRGYAQVDVDQLLADVGAAVGFDPAPPAAGGGSFGFRSARGLTNVKDLNAIYTAHRCATAVDGMAARTVAEIGGGTGTLGYYLRRAGFDRVSLFDLPTGQPDPSLLPDEEPGARPGLAARRAAVELRCRPRPSRSGRSPTSRPARSRWSSTRTRCRRSSGPPP